MCPKNVDTHVELSIFLWFLLYHCNAVDGQLPEEGQDEIHWWGRVQGHLHCRRRKSSQKSNLDKVPSWAGPRREGGGGRSL